MEAVKPCPFCGGKARIVQNDPLMKGEKKFYVFGVICNECDAHFWKNTEEEAIEAWNRRADNAENQ